MITEHRWVRQNINVRPRSCDLPHLFCCLHTPNMSLLSHVCAKRQTLLSIVGKKERATERADAGTSCGRGPLRKPRHTLPQQAMPRTAVLRWPGGHRHKEDVSLEVLSLQEEVQILREEADEAAENMELARMAAKTLEESTALAHEQFKVEQAVVVRLQSEQKAEPCPTWRSRFFDPSRRRETPCPAADIFGSAGLKAQATVKPRAMEKRKRWTHTKGLEAAKCTSDVPEQEGEDQGLPGRGRGSRVSLNLAAAYSAGATTAFLQRYHADLERLAARPDLPAEARWFDSHCHLESILQRTWRGGGKPQVQQNEPQVTLPELVTLWPTGLDGCVANFVFRKESKPGFTPEWEWIAQHLSHFEQGGPVSDRLWFTIGLHPHNAAGWDADAEKTVRHFAAHPKCVGIGECGLDFFKHDPSEEEIQLRAFRAQAELAVELGKALVVHARLVTRENETRFLRELTRVVPQHHPIHIHCFGDSLEHAQELISHYPRLRIGFTGAITFSDPPGKGKAGKGKRKGNEAKKGQEHCRELIQGLPLDRLLIETDGPYMCPEPFRGQTAHPGHVHRVAEPQHAFGGKLPLLMRFLHRHAGSSFKCSAGI
eukprot:s3627_g4.t1